MTAELLRQIWEAPEDRAHLGVYADWLIEHGDATRGEYMQLSLLAKPTPAQRKRREALRTKHRGAWLGAARRYVYTWQEDDASPGFVRWAKCNLAKLAAGFDELRMLGPRVTIAPNTVIRVRDRELLAAQPLGRLWGLGLVDHDAHWVNDELVARIAPKLAGLRRIAVDGPLGEYFTPAGLTKLLDAVAGTVDHVQLTGNYFGLGGEGKDAYVRALLAHPIVPRLRELVVVKPNDAALRKKLQTAMAGRTLVLDAGRSPRL